MKYVFNQKQNENQMKRKTPMFDNILHEQRGQFLRCTLLKQSFWNDACIQKDIGERDVWYLCLIANEQLRQKMSSVSNNTW